MRYCRVSDASTLAVAALFSSVSLGVLLNATLAGYFVRKWKELKPEHRSQPIPRLCAIICLSQLIERVLRLIEVIGWFFADRIAVKMRLSHEQFVCYPLHSFLAVLPAHWYDALAVWPTPLSLVSLVSVFFLRGFHSETAVQL